MSNKLTKEQTKEVFNRVFDTIACPKCGTRIRNVSEKIKKAFRVRAYPRLRSIQCKHCHYKIPLELSENGKITVLDEIGEPWSHKKS